MTYSEIRFIIKQTAEALLAELGGVGLFHYGRESQHPLEGYNQPMPQIWMDPLQDTTNYGTGARNYPITVGFFEQDKSSSNAEEQAALVEKMQVLSDKFFTRLSEHDEFEDITVRRTPLYRHTQAMLTGVVSSFTITTSARLC
ncbi:hypothetical protein [Rufibacter latericius]|uniref:DUF3168 domain-containing protein n=1 Tax=Rufibacter latericius TaxID=2487040 RepID=A0A3M9MM62_9BACT|nr:hypothetical protein [Rufibacter latericius]RNI26616.1 hypothetical protein EFB08_11400 [Rufibacter latericius]